MNDIEKEREFKQAEICTLKNTCRLQEANVIDNAKYSPEKFIWKWNQLYSVLF